jgi:hypothetical protein
LKAFVLFFTGMALAAAFLLSSLWALARGRFLRPQARHLESKKSARRLAL